MAVSRKVKPVDYFRNCRPQKSTKRPVWAYGGYAGSGYPFIVRGRDRRNDLLRRAAMGGVRLHCQGGMQYNGDCRRLVREGLCKLTTRAYAKGWARDLKNPYDLTITFMIATAKGLAKLKELGISTEPETD
jgi:hypothetical protein